MRRICKNRNAATRLLGPELAKSLHARLADIAAAETGKDLKLLPEVFELDDVSGSVVALEKACIVLSAEQGHLSAPRNSRGKIDWEEVMRLKVLEAGDGR